MTVHSNPKSHRQLTRLHTTLAAVALASLAACGGSGGDEAPAAVPAPPVTLTGKVIINEGIMGATVCLDLNVNTACDAGEPTSAATGSDGAYTLSYDSTKITAADLAKAVLIAPIAASATVVDMADSTAPAATKAYVLSTPVSKPGQINPLTTLVQTGVASGLSLADATAAVAVQLGVTEAEIFDYQANAKFDPLAIADSARTLAKITAATLDAGQPLGVTGLAAKQAAFSQQAQFNFTDLNNYYIRNYTSSDKEGTGLSQIADTRTGKTAGADSLQSVLFQSAYLTKTGWVRCDSAGFASTRSVTRGTSGGPDRSAYCSGGQQSAGYNTISDISGKSMGDTLRTMQAATNGSNTVNMNPALVDGKTFPTGSTLSTRKNVLLGDTIYINNLNSTNEVLSGTLYASLETFIKGRQKAAVVLKPAANSGLVWLGLTGDTNHWLAGAFTDETSGVQYYSCTFTANGSNFDTCAEAGTGSFKIVTQNGVRLIKFSGQPNPVPFPTTSFTVGYSEYAPGIMARFRQTRPDAAITSAARLNSVAGDALRAAVGL